MKSNFIDRLIMNALGESDVRIRLAITPDIIPEVFYLPETFYQEQKREFAEQYEKEPNLDVEQAQKLFKERSDKREQKISDIDEHYSDEREERGVYSESHADISSIIQAEDRERRGVEPAKRYQSQYSIDTAKDTNLEKMNVRSIKSESNISHDDSVDVMQVDMDERSESIEESRSQIHVSDEKRYNGVEIADGYKPRDIEELKSKKIKHVLTERYRLLRIHELDEILKRQKTQDLEPSITINIGRIEVNAINKPNKTPQARPTLSLKEYLKKRSEGML